MTKLSMTIAAVAALLVLPAANTAAFANSEMAGVTAASDSLAALDTPVESSTARKIDLQAEPIEQTGQVTEPETQPAEEPGAEPVTAAPETTDAAVGSPAEISEPIIAEPQTAKRICRKFSAAIAMVIEVPCESIN